MPEIVDDAKDSVENNWKPALAYGLATGVGSRFGPLGEGAGAVAAGSYIGGEKGSTITMIGGGQAVRNLLAMGGGSSGGSSGGRGRM